MSRRFERVVVALDAASDNRTAIDTAAQLAARVDALLHGIFIEDEELLWAAGLSFTRESMWGAGGEPFTLERTARQLRAAADTARRDLVAIAGERRLAASFEVRRGSAAHVLAAATERDLLVGGLSRPVAGHFRVESRWFNSVETATGPVLLARRAWSADGGIIVLLQGRDPGAIRLLEAAAEIAAAAGASLLVMASPAIADAGGWVGERLAVAAVPWRIETAPAEPEALDRRIAELGCRLLAIEPPVEGPVAARLCEWSEKVGCDILVVR
jgi:hypothetical protein